MSALGDTCPFSLCDGTGFVVDEATRGRAALPLPRPGASSATARAASAP